MNDNYLSTGATKLSMVESVKNFHEVTIAHPLLEEKTKEVINTIKNPEGYSLFMVVGPTGVGKTTLIKKVIKSVLQELQEEMVIDNSFIPIVGMELISPDSGKFDWKDYYKRALEKLNEPMIDHKVDYSKVYPQHYLKHDQMMTSGNRTGRELRRSLENAFYYRKTLAFIIDEAQHFAKMGSGRRLQDQLDTIKSISNLANVIHVLVGTYELLPFLNLSGQLSRRTIDIHFPRYKATDKEEVKKFKSVINTFEKRLPLEEASNLIQYWEFLYERTIGCVGVLKNWLERCLREALAENHKSISYDLLKKHALSLAKVEKMIEEVLEGEAAFVEEEEKSKRIQTILGISCPNSENTTTVDMKNSNFTSHRGRSKVGQRNPVRDSVGIKAST